MSMHEATSADLFAHDGILPTDPFEESGEPLEVLHDREYRIRAFRAGDDVVLIRGAVRDQKPPGLYFENDPDPLTVHHMQIDIEVRYPTMEIIAARVGIEVHPNAECTRIVDHYDSLVGLSIARGFTHRVRELFGGPRGCTHTTALLQAMAPVAMQCVWSMRASTANRLRASRAGEPSSEPAAGDAEGSTAQHRSELWKMNLNTCHVWAEDSDVVARIRDGEMPEPPVFAAERMVTLGLKPQDWAARMG